MTQPLHIQTTPIEGLLVIHLPLHGDNRGWFKEHWQRQKMIALGLPDFGPVQQNISYNATTGTTRGVHAEPWDKYVSVANGRAYGAWVDLREGPGFGTSFAIELTPSVAVFVPYGVANGFQTLEPDTSYMYLVNDHWSPTASYTFVNLADPKINITWPIPLDQATISDKDHAHPNLADVIAMPRKKTVVLGSDGQLGKALQETLDPTRTVFLTRNDLDLTNLEAIEKFDWTGVETIINAAAYTAVDTAETPEGRIAAWAINATAVSALSRISTQRHITLVHISSDYVFDGTKEIHHEDEPFSPLGVYGQTKAAGDLAAQTTPQHYIIRTSWVIGDGPNFVRTMAKLAKNGVSPSVVNDQHGRLTFTSDIANCIIHLLTKRPTYGTYNLTSDGPATSWYDIARAVFELLEADSTKVSSSSTEEYLAANSTTDKLVSPRPQFSTLDLTKITNTGFIATNANTALSRYTSAL